MTISTMTPEELELAIHDIYGREHGRITRLAKAVNLCRATIYNYLAGAWPIPIDVARKVCGLQREALAATIAVKTAELGALKKRAATLENA